MLFIVDSDRANSDCSSANLTYSVSYDIRVTGNCIRDYSGLNTGPCSCHYWHSLNDRCVFLVDCSALMRNLSVSSLWDRKTVESVHLDVRLNEGEINFIRYYQTNFKCTRESDEGSICDLASADRDVYCETGVRNIVYACKCINPDQKFAKTKRISTSDPIEEYWLSTPSAFVETVNDHLATGDLGRKYNFFVIWPNLREKFYESLGDNAGNEIFESETLQNEFRDSILRYLINNVCVRNEEKYDFLLAYLINIVIPFN